MPRSVAQARFHKDRALRWLYYRPYLIAGGVTLFGIFVISLLAGQMSVRKEQEWKGVHIQQAEATCLRSYPMSTSQPLLVDERWVNTYLINNQQRTVYRSESCVVGKPYRLKYRLSKSGRFAISAQTALTRE